MVPSCCLSVWGGGEGAETDEACAHVCWGGGEWDGENGRVQGEGQIRMGVLTKGRVPPLLYESVCAHGRPMASGNVMEGNAHRSAGGRHMRAAMGAPWSMCQGPVSPACPRWGWRADRGPPHSGRWCGSWASPPSKAGRAQRGRSGGAASDGDRGSGRGTGGPGA